ncbi:MAG: GumC family protein [Hyphomicrobiaceae bacterium]
MTIATEEFAGKWQSPPPTRPDGLSRTPLRLLRASIRLAWVATVAAIVVATMRAPRSVRRYLVGGIATTSIIWLIVGAYLALAKPSYTTRWTLILPTSTSSVSMQVESIGHAQTTPSSPFGSASLSPKVIYKEIIGSEQVRRAAAQVLGMKLEEFGTPRIKLIDETALMLFEINGPSAELAQQKGNVLIEAFHRQLDMLRRDEILRRAEVVQESLKSYQINLQSARDRILDQQQRTGVLSLNQYNEASTGLELMRRRLADVRAEIGRLTVEQKLLGAEIGIAPKAAAALLRLSADPAFSKVVSEFADSNSLYQQEAGRLGPNNPLLAVSRKRAAAASEQLRTLALAAGLDADADAEPVALVMNGTHRSELVKAIVASDAAIAGKREELAALEAEFRQHSETITRMSGSAARLEDLRKDHLVAEAVFTSALARLDTNKVDIYASYPMVQTLSAPDLTEKKSSPNTLVAMLGGLVASLLGLVAWGMAWLRHMFARKR